MLLDVRTTVKLRMDGSIEEAANDDKDDKDEGGAEEDDEEEASCLSRFNSASAER